MRLHTLEQKLPEHETAPPGQAAEANRYCPNLLCPRSPEGNTTDISQEAKRCTDGVAESAAEVLASSSAPCLGRVDVARLFSHFGVNRAEDGPFVPLTAADQPAGGIVADGLASIRGLAKTLPCRYRSRITKSEAGSVRTVTCLTGGLRSTPG